MSIVFTREQRRKLSGGRSLARILRANSNDQLKAFLGVRVSTLDLTHRNQLAAAGFTMTGAHPGADLNITGRFKAGDLPQILDLDFVTSCELSVRHCHPAQKEQK